MKSFICWLIHCPVYKYKHCNKVHWGQIGLRKILESEGIYMSNNDGKMQELARIKPILEDFINKYCCPHDALVVRQGSIEIFSGEVGIPLEILD